MPNNYDKSVMENYRTLACEIALYAYNDYIRYTIALYSLEHPDENEFTTAHYLKIAKQMKSDIKFRRMKCNLDILETSLLRDFYRAVPDRKRVLRKKIGICEDFFKDPHPVAGYLGLGEEVLANADEVVDKWLETGEAMLLKTVRAERGTLRDIEVYDV